MTIKTKNKVVPLMLLLTVSAILVGIDATIPEAAAAPGFCPPGNNGIAGGPLWVAWGNLPPLPAGNTADYACFQNKPAVGAGCGGAGAGIGCISNQANLFAAGIPPAVIINPAGCPNLAIAVPPPGAGQVSAGNEGVGNGAIAVNWGPDCALSGARVAVVFACPAGCVPGKIDLVAMFSPTPPPGNVATTDAGLQLCTSNPCQIGGSIIPIDKLALVTPYLGVASLLGSVTALSVVYLRRVKGKKDDK